MKRLFAAALAAFTSFAFGATLNPISLLNPAGSTSGQVIASTGPSTAPAWTTVTLSGLSGTVAITNGGTGATSAASARTNLGVAASGANTDITSLNAPSLGAATATTQAVATNNTTVATTGYVVAKLASPTPIGSSAPSSGAFTSLTSSGTLTPTGGIVGVTNASTPTAGNVGEVLSITPSNTACPTSATTANLGSLSLTAGDWMVTGSVLYTAGASTTLSNMVGGLSTTSAALPGAADYGQIQAGGAAATSTSVVMPSSRVNVSTTTSVYAVGQVTYSGTCNYAVRIRAWRMR